jgi:DNA-binding XRE family transcriptional regulator
MTNDITEREPVARFPPARERRRLRELFGVTQEQLAENVGVSPRTMIRWEKGEGTPRGPKGIRYAEILAKWGERAKQQRR